MSVLKVCRRQGNKRPLNMSIIGSDTAVISLMARIANRYQKRGEEL